MKRKRRDESEGREAREVAEQMLEAVRSRRPAAEHEARQMRFYQRENDLSRKFWAAMGGKP